MSVNFEKLIDVDLLGRMKTHLDVIFSKKTDININGNNGLAKMFNESDGGGAKFEHQDGTWSFVGVNDGGENGITGQLYSVKRQSGISTGSRLNMTNGGFYYTRGKSNAAYSSGDELAVLSDLDVKANADDVYTKAEVDSKLVGGLHYKGVKATVADLPSSGQQIGDLWHVTEDAGDYAWEGSSWEDMGAYIDLSPYAKTEDFSLATNEDIDALFD